MAVRQSLKTRFYDVKKAITDKKIFLWNLLQEDLEYRLFNLLRVKKL